MSINMHISQGQNVLIGRGVIEIHGAKHVEHVSVDLYEEYNTKQAEGSNDVYFLWRNVVRICAHFLWQYWDAQCVFFKLFW